MDSTNFHNNESQSRRSNMRASTASRFSRLFGRGRADATMNPSHRTSAACSVPIFLSPSSDRVDAYHAGNQSPHLDADHYAPASHLHQRFTIPASSVYSESPGQQHERHFMQQIEEQPSETPELVRDLEEGTSSLCYSSSQAPIMREKRRRKRRAPESTRQRIDAKKRLSMAFGITVLAAITTCKSSQFTGPASN